MRYDDPQRPQSDIGAVHTPLQVNKSPLPTITLMYPMQNGDQSPWRCTGSACPRSNPPHTLNEDEQPCARCVGDAEWGWLCCIHAHRESNRFGTYYGWIRDLGQFQADYLADPENALLKYFKYSGPDWEPTTHSPRGTQEIKEEIF
jgi:hypothetical protein